MNLYIYRVYTYHSCERFFAFVSLEQLFGSNDLMPHYNYCYYYIV